MYLTSVCPRDQLGPYFDEGSPYDYNLAPEKELADPTKLAVLQGKVGEDWMKICVDKCFNPKAMEG